MSGIQVGSELEQSAEARSADVAAALGRLSGLRAELLKMHRLVLLGTAAATIAHEFNNLMTPVVGYAKVAMDAGDAELMKKALAMTLRQTATGAAMCRRILGLATGEGPLRGPVSVQEVVEEAVGCLCRDLSKDGITLTVKVSDGLRLLGDPRQIQQVLFNLLLNARQALTGRTGRITIEASRVGDESVAISVRDTGRGIPPGLRDRIFEPFVTTKENGAGTGEGVGLGLALCRDIVTEHGGAIEVESEVNVGTTFTITLPAG